MKKISSVSFLLLFYCAFVSYTTAQKITADLVLLNARVRTMDAAQPSAEAVAVIGNRIAAVGSSKEMRKMIGASTKVVDAQGKLVLPGFNDSHTHFLSGGFQLSSVDLRDARSKTELAERIGKFAAKLPKGRWITGGDWDHENWSPAELPTRQMIDAMTPETPVFVTRLDGHMALANSLALKLAGITRDTKDPEGGLIVRDAQGEPTGVLKDGAMNLVYAVMPDGTFAEKLEAAQAASDYAASLGVTSVQDMSAGNDVGVYQELLRRGTLKTRIYAVSTMTDWQRWQRAGIRYAFGDAMLRVGGLKGFADGSLGSTTAWFDKPYLDEPNSVGFPLDEMAKMRERAVAADQAGLQMMVHAIGDRANREVLDVFAAVEKENGARDRRFRIEHAQHLNEPLIKRFASQKVVASMQPFHIIDDGRWAFKRLDNERLKGTYAFRMLLDNGVTLAFGSDWTVAPLNPLLGVYAAVTRRTLDGKNPNGWFPEQKISVEETVRAYTYGSAFAEFQEKEKGTISTGKLADLVILSADIFQINPNEIDKTQVLTTIVDGKVVFERK